LLRATSFYDFFILKSPPPLFRSKFILKIKNVTGKGREYVVVATLVEFLVWLRNFAQVEMKALLGCRRGFVNPLTTNFLVT
jgi:hypothetical protein